MHPKLRAALDGRPQDPDLITAVGLVGMITGHVEVEVSTILYVMIGEPFGAQLSFGQNVGANITTIRELLKTVESTPLIEEIKDALARTKDLTDKRNDLVHSLWGGGSDGSTTLRFRYWNKRIYPRPTRSVDEVVALYEEMAAIATELGALWGRVELERSSWTPAST